MRTDMKMHHASCCAAAVLLLVGSGTAWVREFDVTVPNDDALAVRNVRQLVESLGALQPGTGLRPLALAGGS